MPDPTPHGIVPDVAARLTAAGAGESDHVPAVAVTEPLTELAVPGRTGWQVVGLVPLVDLSPLAWLGGLAASAAGDAWREAMIYLWSAGLWLIRFAFAVIDAFTTPDLSAGGPVSAVLPTTMGIALVLVTVLSLVQMTLALVRRDGGSLARLVLGTVQFGGIWVGYLAALAVAVVAVHGLTQALLSSLLDVTSFADIPTATSWPRQVTDGVTATVLGLCTLFLVLPAAIAVIVVMLTRAAALLVLAAVTPITAAGLLSEATKRWFWVANRWFLAALFVPPLTALVLGIGVRITAATASGVGQSTEAAVGTAVVGCILIALAAVCPLALFRLLAFVDPGTTTGAAFRTALAANGGWSGALSGGSGAAAQQTPAGQAQGEQDAEASTGSRINAVLGPLGQLNDAVMGTVRRAADQSSDALTMAGVGHQAMFYGRDPYADTSRRRAGGTGSSGTGSTDSREQDPSVEPGDEQPPTPPPTAVPPAPPGGWDGPDGGSGAGQDPPGPGPGGTPGGPRAGASGPAGGGAGGAAAGGEAAAAAAVV